ncbi:MAG TPA: hypothetical protein VK324_02935 [Tepidisphaeraceae bacterium]|nr:hypothetical protein [Tepidisphaeraceae bacterium]
MAQVKEQREDIKAFTLNGVRHEVSSGRDALVTLCELLAGNDPKLFEQWVPALVTYGKDKRWFSSSREGMHAPRQIKGTTLWVDANQNTRTIKKICEDVAKVFGIARSQLSFETRKTSRV